MRPNRDTSDAAEAVGAVPDVVGTVYGEVVRLERPVDGALTQGVGEHGERSVIVVGVAVSGFGGMGAATACINTLGAPAVTVF